jgi:hypothetical protein
MTRAGPSESFESRTATPPGSPATSIQFALLPLWLLLRHAAWIRSALTLSFSPFRIGYLNPSPRRYPNEAVLRKAWESSGDSALARSVLQISS